MRRVEYMLGGEDFKKMTAGHFKQTEVYYFSEESAVVDIISVITASGFGSVPITGSGKKVVGIVSEFDLLKAVMNGQDLRKLTAKDIMTRDVVTVMEDTPAEKIMSILQEKHLIRVPVVDKDKALIGVVARRDVLLGFLKSLESGPPMTFNLL